MTNKVWMITCSAILGFAATAMTQTTPQAQSNPSSADKKVTITGCLAAAPASPESATGTTGTTGTAGTAGTTGAAGAAGTTAGAGPAFQLTNATVSAADSTENAAGAAPTEPKTTPAEGKTFRLLANPTALSPHVGKKLALTGTLEEPSASTTTTAGEAKGPALRVESGKIIAESCNQ